MTMLSYMYLMLQEVNINKFCNSCVELVCNKAPSLRDDAEQVAEKHKAIFHLFAACREDYDSAKVFSDADLHTLGKL